MAKTPAYTDGSGEELIDELRELRNDHNGLALHVGQSLGAIRHELREMAVALPASDAEVRELRALVLELRGKLDTQHGMISALEAEFEPGGAAETLRRALDHGTDPHRTSWAPPGSRQRPRGRPRRRRERPHRRTP